MADSTTSTIVTIHGFGFDRRIWLPLELAFHGRNVLHLDLPGFGGSEVLKMYTIPELARMYWAQIEQIGEGSIQLVGHSMGGYVAMEMAAQSPGRLASVSLIHSHVFADPPEKKEARDKSIASLETHGRRALVEAMIPSLFGDADAFDPIIRILKARAMDNPDDAWIAATRAMRDRHDHAATLQNLGVPVLLVSGELDAAVPIELSYRQASLAERTKLCVYPGIGHLGMYEATPRLLTDLADFLQFAEQG